MPKGVKVIAQNKKARHDYFIEDTFEAGISLAGTEVKSIRLGKANLKDAFAQVENGEMLLQHMHVSPYEKGNIFNKDPLRARKLLLHRAEISRLNGLVTQKGFSLVPLSLYLKNGLVKVELAVVRGKKLYDKRGDIASKDAERDMQRHLKDFNR
jgi:SsrA-binding protein